MSLTCATIPDSTASYQAAGAYGATTGTMMGHPSFIAGMTAYHLPSTATPQSGDSTTDNMTSMLCRMMGTGFTTAPQNISSAIDTQRYLGSASASSADSATACYMPHSYELDANGSAATAALTSNYVGLATTPTVTSASATLPSTSTHLPTYATQLANGHYVPAALTSSNAASQLSTGQLAAGQLSTGQLTPGQLTGGALATASGIAAAGMTTSGIAASNMAAAGMTASGVAAAGMTPSGVTTSGMTASGIAAAAAQITRPIGSGSTNPSITAMQLQYMVSVQL